jgi:hypothetical protein
MIDLVKALKQANDASGIRAEASIQEGRRDIAALMARATVRPIRVVRFGALPDGIPMVQRRRALAI